MEYTITVEVKNVFGKRLIYPIDTNAKRFAALTGKKTLDTFDIEQIKALGFTVEVQTPTL